MSDCIWSGRAKRPGQHGRGRFPQNGRDDNGLLILYARHAAHVLHLPSPQYRSIGIVLRGTAGDHSAEGAGLFVRVHSGAPLPCPSPVLRRGQGHGVRHPPGPGLVGVPSHRGSRGLERVRRATGGTRYLQSMRRSEVGQGSSKGSPARQASTSRSVHRASCSAARNDSRSRSSPMSVSSL